MVRIKMKPGRFGRLIPVYENTGCQSLTEIIRGRISSRISRKKGMPAAALWYYLFF